MHARKERVAHYLDTEKMLPGDVRNLAAKVMQSAQWDDEGPALAGLMGVDHGGAPSDIDDEYRHAGVDDPKIFITTSHNPSSRLKMFAKEMKLIIPNSERMNRGSFDVKSLLSSAKSNGFTDVVILHETRGRPDHMVVSHLPNGPTAYYTLMDVKLRHDIPDCGTMSEAYPHLIFHNFNTRLAKRIQSTLKYLFPVPKLESVRSLSFINHSDFIIFRHHVANKGEKGMFDSLTEVGPQFTMLCHKIIRGTVDEEKAADVEFVLRPYLNTAHKRLLLSKDMPWKTDDDVARVDRETDMAK
ncbi:U3 small nucleolar ribonucleoprotein protein IMP4 [Hyalella azteca]|uniref:U3 small nucleolar ribonucleoprotein protein IMP4 n=1 Tax=Hyalella azteca TaxID=294128 RepID=A0A8B7P3K9_HYAAZ|nr:U3 small nucleolar ribonucleoprotein protein IMP4 [Hyalella azteca]